MHVEHDISQQYLGKFGFQGTLFRTRTPSRGTQVICDPSHGIPPVTFVSISSSSFCPSHALPWEKVPGRGCAQRCCPGGGVLEAPPLPQFSLFAPTVLPARVLVADDRVRVARHRGAPCSRVLLTCLLTPFIQRVCVRTALTINPARPWSLGKSAMGLLCIGRVPLSSHATPRYVDNWTIVASLLILVTFAEASTRSPSPRPPRPRVMMKVSRRDFR